MSATTPQAHVTRPLSSAAISLAGALVLVVIAWSRAGVAHSQTLEERAAMAAELEQRDRRIDELERALNGARFRAPEQGPAEEIDESP